MLSFQDKFDDANRILWFHLFLAMEKKIPKISNNNINHCQNWFAVKMLEY